MSGVTTPQAVMLARAAVARRLIREGQVSPWTALFYVVCPTEGIREAEGACPAGTIQARAYSFRDEAA